MGGRFLQADNSNRRSAVIFDVDGVLLDIRHLLDDHIFNRPVPDWPAFNAGLHTCTPIATYIGLCNALWDGGFQVFLLTSRAERLRSVTEGVLVREGVRFDQLLMRQPDDDYRGFKCLKAAELAQEYDIVAVFEDDPVNVMAFKHMRLPTVPIDSGYHDHPWVNGAESTD